MTRVLTGKQRTAMGALKAAQAAGVGLSAYARAHGLNARQLHDSIVGLRRRGVLPPTDRARKGGFVAVRVADTQPSTATMRLPARSGMVCRVVHSGGLLIECAEWPPPAWVAALTGRADAAS